MTKYLPKPGDIAEYTFPTGPSYVRPGAHDGETVHGKVLAVGETYADVKWAPAGRVERIRFRKPDGVTFKPAAA